MKSLVDQMFIEVKELHDMAKKDQEIAHEKGEDCEHDDCQDCHGEFYGHEYDPDEGGYCMCGANGYENGE
jgi:hypothetical protein